MSRNRYKASIGTTMVLLGLAQAGWGVMGNDQLFAALGLGYAAIGLGYLWTEVCTAE
ncbi:hypothetical protein [Haloterrigena sp. H1]|uniref:hypothetical protein n=1 Tax=Haloterrigena sp. H1 TaxID=2552943 RepID=UPI00148699A5|nr:hypothetical protein [Haloterrigena sp. H1]